MDILFVATELAPMVKVGGLADVIGALSKALRLLGHNVTIALPRFAAIEQSGLMIARRLTPLSFDGPSGRVDVTVFDGRLGSGVDLTLLDIPGEGGSLFFDRAGVYGEGGQDYPDNDRRFGLFCRAVVELVKARAASATPFDVVHAHDWPTAMVPYLLAAARTAGAPIEARSVLTLHNVAHQGVFPKGAMAWLGLSDEHFVPEKLEFYGSVNYLKGGIVSADAVTTVSTTYASEILTPEHGAGLEGVLGAREGGVTGIVNGIDYAVFNPMTDPMIAARYDADDPSNKGRCKSALCQELGLSIDVRRPLVASLGRVVPQKGTDLLAVALPKLLRSDVSVAIAGSGSPAIMESLEKAVAKAPGRAVYAGQVSEGLAHRLMAGADFVVVPSRFEPCGLVQLYAQRYGAIPVATRTGGLSDTIVDCDADLETGTGFLFDKATSADLLGGLQRAIAAFASPRFGALRRRVMRLDLGWDRPARRYVKVYANALASQGRGR